MHKSPEVEEHRVPRGLLWLHMQVPFTVSTVVEDETILYEKKINRHCYMGCVAKIKPCNINYVAMNCEHLRSQSPVKTTLQKVQILLMKTDNLHIHLLQPTGKGKLV